MPEYILSIDWGSTRVKGGLFDGELSRLAETSRPVPYSIRDAERAELDPERVWQVTKDVITDTCTDAGVEAGEIASIALTSQAQTFTILDAGGRPIMPFLSWLDRRARAEADRVADALGDDFHHSCSYPNPRPAIQLCKLLWIREHEPELLAEANRIALLTSFLALRLAGVLAEDRNLAAMTGMYSLCTGRWWDEALNLCGCRTEQLPQLVDVGATLTAVEPCAELGLRPDVRITLAGNDQTAGAFGNCCHDGGLILTLGTALVSYRHAGSTPGPYSPGGCWGPYPDGGYYELAGQDEGCIALDWAREQLMPGKDVETFVDLARSASTAPHQENVLFYPRRMETDAAWVGEGDEAARALAVLEGISFNLRHLIEQGLRVCLPAPTVTVSGGGSKSPFWLQLLADVLNTPVRRATADALLGAAAMAMGRVPCLDGGQRDSFPPRPEQVERYERLFRTWLPGRP